jgi:predicted Rossmann fold flavoprotein
MSKHHYDVIVIGGGASGLQAAAVAMRGRSVLVIEKNDVLGKKLSITGGGRCNILNAEPDTRTLLSHYGDAAPFLFSPFSQHGMEATMKWFVDQGLPIVVEGGLRAFPASHRAADVIALFIHLLKKHNVTALTSVTVTGFEKAESAIIGVVTNRGVFTASSYIIATGGLSHPETGSTGDGHKWLLSLDLKVHTPNPSLVPLVCSEGWVHKMAGVSVADAGIIFKSKQGGVYKNRGKVLFTHFGLSGPAILNSARDVRHMFEVGPVDGYINLRPDLLVEDVHSLVLATFAQHKNKKVENVIRYLVPAGTAAAVIAHLSPTLLEAPVHSASRPDRVHIGDIIHKLPVTVTGTKGDDWSIVSDGGLDLIEVDTKTMCLRKYPNVFVTGDILHISRPSGGYSLQLCWTTGTVAGRHA